MNDAPASAAVQSAIPHGTVINSVAATGGERALPRGLAVHTISRPGELNFLGLSVIPHLADLILGHDPPGAERLRCPADALTVAKLLRVALAGHGLSAPSGPRQSHLAGVLLESV